MLETETLMTDFDIGAYFGALDTERIRRGLTWAGLTRELNAPFAHRPDIHPISSSTITGMRSRGSLNGNIVVHTLMWLRRAPEEFMIDHPVEPGSLPELEVGHLRRWDTVALYETIDARRDALQLSWSKVAVEVGGFTSETLRSLRNSVGFPRVMRVLGWLRRPAAEFVLNLPV